MPSRYALLLVTTLIFVAVACRSQQPPPPAAAPASTAGDYIPTATIKDVMDSMVDPSADYLWESVATVVTKAGIEERSPKTEEDWKQEKRRAVTLVEATNVLLVPGRHVAKPGEKSENPNIELEPEEIESMLAKDRATWVKYVHGLHDAAADMLNAVNERKVPALFDGGEKLDTACENCHMHYWYPNQVIPTFPGTAPAPGAVRNPSPRKPSASQ